MATDVARLSFDAGRFYRGVVPQQGRVSLEAEQNEQRIIDSEERRLELIDIVGPVGTPDDGYAVSQGTGFDLNIGQGTMYVGGWRVELDTLLDVGDQPDWLDRPPAPNADHVPSREHIALMVSDTDVTAVEDPALYEVALGGPDGAARTRLLQHIVRLPIDAGTCADALTEDEKLWAADGLRLDPKSMELKSASRLHVTWEGDPQPASPCEPSSTGGYLGAENQCIRVQITAVNGDGTFDFVWGYDEASFLYRVTPDQSTNPVLTLDRTPVDDYHRPRAGQAVQALRSTADLKSTDAYTEGYVAALGGVVGVLATPYDPDTKTVQFPSALPTDYTDTTQNPQLYLRVWEKLVSGAAQGTPISLTGTGMAVTISAARAGQLHVDDFWCIAVRPATPTTVYPDRYLREAQPPDGPHQWVCPLAVVEWVNGKLVILEDCRKHFPPLTDIEEGGCCTVEVRPSDTARLQEIIDKAVAARITSDRADRVTICFSPGRYELTAPLVLRRDHSNLTLRGCNEAAVLAVESGQDSKFGQGLIVLDDADNVTITGFELVMPQAPGASADAQPFTGGFLAAEDVRTINTTTANRYVSIAIRPVNCAVLEVTNCLFRFRVGDAEQVAEVSPNARDVLGIGIFAAGGLWGLRARGNRFLHESTIPLSEGGPKHLLAGFVHTDVLAPKAFLAKTYQLGGSTLPALLQDAEFVDNEFHGLAAAILVVAQMGEVRVRDNIVRGGYGGFWLMDAKSALRAASMTGKTTLPGGSHGGLDFVVILLLLAAATYPLPHYLGPVVRHVAQLDATQLEKFHKQAATDRTAFEALFTKRLQADNATYTGSAPTPGGAEPIAAAEAQSPATDLGTHRFLSGLALATSLGQHYPVVSTSLRVEHNSVDCQLPGDAPTGSALFTLLPIRDEQHPSTATIDANRLFSGGANPVVAIFGGSAITVTGNLVAIAPEEGHSLVVGLVRMVAITGNVVQGPSRLPMRGFPAPLDTWLPLNTMS